MKLEFFSVSLCILSLYLFVLLIDQTIRLIIQVKASLSVEYKGNNYCIVELIPENLQSYIESDFAEFEDAVLYSGQSCCDIGIAAILHF